MALALQIFERSGWEFLARWAHVVAGITWIGLLYYFNFVQVPSFARDGGRRPATTRSTSSRPGRCGGSAGPRWRRCCSGC